MHRNTKQKILNSLLFEYSRNRLVENEISSKQIRKAYKHLVWHNDIGNIIKFDLINSYQT